MYTAKAGIITTDVNLGGLCSPRMDEMRPDTGRVPPAFAV